MKTSTSTRLYQVVAAIAIVPCVVGFAFVANNYLLQAGTTLAMSAVLCLAWNIVGGFMGYPSFATAAFFGLGAYIGGILQNHGAPLALAWLVAAAGGAAVAMFLGMILLGLRGHYFAIGTIALVEVMREVANNWEAVTGGAIGMNVPITPGTPREVGIFFYLVMWGLVAANLVLTALIARAKFGFGLRCIRQNERAASMVGINVFWFKVNAFIVSGLLIAFTGAVYGSMVAFIEPKDVFNVLMSIEVPVMVMLGGAGTIIGPVVGAAVYILLRELVWVNFINFHTAILGIIIVAVIYFIPRGVLRPLQAKGVAALRVRLARARRLSVGKPQ